MSFLIFYLCKPRNKEIYNMFVWWAFGVKKMGVLLHNWKLSHPKHQTSWTGVRKNQRGQKKKIRTNNGLFSFFSRNCPGEIVLITVFSFSSHMLLWSTPTLVGVGNGDLHLHSSLPPPPLNFLLSLPFHL